MQKDLLKYLMVLIFFFSSWHIGSATPSNQHPVKTGIFIDHIYQVNLANQSADVIFWAWAVHQDQYPIGERFELMNTTNMTILHHRKDSIPGTNKVRELFHIRATIIQNWHFYRFPFGHHQLKIRIENHDRSNAWHMVPDFKNSGYQKHLTIPGWDIINTKLSTSTEQYHSNFGLPGNNTSRYQALEYTLDIGHTNIHWLIHIFGMLILALFLTLCVFIVPIDDLKSRIALLTGAIFAVVGNKIATDGLLPPLSIMTILDKIQIATIVYMALTLVVILALLYTHQKNQRYSKWFNAISGTIVIGLMLMTNIYYLWF